MRRQTFIEYHKFIVAVFVCSIVTALFSFVQFLNIDNSSDISKTVDVDADFSDITLIIDAGHGGEDGGAVGITGSLEKDINLSIAQKLNDLFGLVDIDVVMTRNDDTLLYTSQQSSRKKYYDLRNRRAVADNYENPVFVSIHQNKFPISKYNGLQVYYSQNHRDSENLASIIQSSACAYLQKDNRRTIKEASSSIYLMHSLECPAVLVECGFLSNPQEEELLESNEYQSKMAFVIFSAVIEYLSDNKSID